MLIIYFISAEDFCHDKTGGRRNRTTYKRWQIEELERAFALNPYPTSVFKKSLALRLGLRDSRVQVTILSCFHVRISRFKVHPVLAICSSFKDNYHNLVTLHTPKPCDLDVWCRGDFVRRSEMLRFKVLKRNLSYLILSSGLVPKSSREGKTRKARLVWVSKWYRSGNYRGGKIFRGGKSNWRRGKQRTWRRRRLKRSLFALIFIQYHWVRFWQWSYNNIQTRITKPSSLIMPTSI